MFAVLLIRSFGLHAVLRLCSEFHRFPVLALLDSQAADASSRQRGRAPLLELTAAAEAAGVRLGMTASQALARCSRLRFIQKNCAAETAAQEELLAHAAHFTPDYENTAPGVVTLDLRHVVQTGDGPPTRRGDPRAHCLPDLLRETFAHPLHLGFASTPDLAHLAAHLGPAPDFSCRIPPETTKARAFLAPLPLDVLPPFSKEDESFKRLRQWGLRTLGDLATLPRDEIVRRLGLQGGTLWDYATGQNRRLLRLVHPVADYSQDFQFEHPIETAEPLFLVLEAMIETLCARLASAWLVAHAMQLKLRFENGLTHERELRIAEPCADSDLFLRLLQRHLDGFTATAPITRVVLEMQPAPPPHQQTRLFENSLRDPNRLAETLSHLETLLGKDRIGVPHLLPTRHPDGFLVRPFLDAVDDSPQWRRPALGPRREGAPSPDSRVGAPSPSAEARLSLLPPLRRFRPPLAARVRFEEGRPAEVDAGAIRGHIQHAEGPWPLSGEWWDTTRNWSWQEWDVWLESGAYRLGQQPENTWQLTGTYG
ncbi:MAG: DNA polymerase Y family protein [Verrucomicrobiales bacterium]